VEALVRAVERGEVVGGDGRFLFGQDRAQARRVVRTHAFRRLFDDRRLQRVAHEIGLVQRVERDARDERARARHDLDQAFVGQALHGLVHGRAARAEFLGDVALHDARTGQHVHLDDAPAQAQVDAARRAQAAFRLGRWIG